jgi:hypothetical protein
MSKRLTDISIRNLKPRATRREVPDGNGLYVIVQPSGKKSYAVRYRYAGKPRKVTFPGTLTLKAARRRPMRFMNSSAAMIRARVGGVRKWPNGYRLRTRLKRLLRSI